LGKNLSNFKFNLFWDYWGLFEDKWRPFEDVVGDVVGDVVEDVVGTSLKARRRW